jgi:hypothetical protein
MDVTRTSQKWTALSQSHHTWSGVQGRIANCGLRSCASRVEARYALILPESCSQVLMVPR